MMKVKFEIQEMSMQEFCDAKNFAFCIGRKCIGSFNDVLSWIFSSRKIDICLNEYGKQWEIVVMFVLGVMSSHMKTQPLWAYSDFDADSAGIDIMLNHHPIQLKFAWSQKDKGWICEYKYTGIFLSCAPWPDERDAGDIFAEILKAAGFSDSEVEIEVKENPGFDATYEAWKWFTGGLC